MDALMLTDELESDDDLWKWKTRNQLFTRVAHTSFKALVDTIRTETGRVVWTGFYTDASGLRRMAQFLKVIASTTKTAIGEIIGCAIWSLCGFLPTLQNMLLNECPTQSLERGSESTWTRPESKPRNGTVLQKVLNGILNKGKIVGLIAAHQSAHAACAAGATRPFEGDTAHPTALKSLAIVRSLFLGPVRCAAKVLRQANINHPSTALSPAELLPWPGSSKVYTLSLDKHNVYYANGVLVANCDAIVCALEGARRLGFPLGKHTPDKLPPLYFVLGLS